MLFRSVGTKLNDDAIPTSRQVDTKLRTDALIAETASDSARTVQRYIRLTYLIPQLLQMVDDKFLPFTVGVTLSFFSTQEQSLIFDFCLHNKISTITASQAELLKANINEIDIELLSEIFCKKAIKEKNISIKLPISMFPSNIGKIEIDNVLAEKISHLITEYYTKKDEE